MTNNSYGAFTVNEFLDWARISRTKFYQQISAGNIEVRKLGKKTLGLRSEAERWLDELPAINGGSSNDTL
jgi:hypothetical protein